MLSFGEWIIGQNHFFSPCTKPGCILSKDRIKQAREVLFKIIAIWSSRRGAVVNESD